VALQGVTNHKAMKTIQANDTRLIDLVEEVARGEEPISVETESSRAVLVSMTEWNAIQETLYLLSIPGMRESIREGMQTSIDQCSVVAG